MLISLLSWSLGPVGSRCSGCECSRTWILLLTSDLSIATQLSLYLGRELSSSSLCLPSSPRIFVLIPHVDWGKSLKRKHGGCNWSQSGNPTSDFSEEFNGPPLPLHPMPLDFLSRRKMTHFYLKIRLMNTFKY